MQPVQPIHFQQQAGDGRANHVGECDGRKKHRHEAAPHGHRKPLREVVHDPREEPGFCNAEQKPQHVHAAFALGQGHRHRDETPGQHDAENPQPRSYARQKHVRRHLEEEVANEEDAAADAVGILGDAEVLVHRQCGEAHIDAVKKAGDIEHAQKREQPPRGLCEDLVFHTSPQTCFSIGL